MSKGPFYFGLTGKNGSGKGVVADYFKTLGFQAMSLSDILRERLRADGKDVTRENLIELGNRLRSDKGPGVLGELVAEKILGHGLWAVDSIRHPDEVKALRKLPGFKLIEVWAPDKTRFERMVSRAREGDPVTFEAFLKLEQKEASSDQKSDQQLDGAIGSADLRIENDGSLEKIHQSIDGILKESGWEGSAT